MFTTVLLLLACSLATRLPDTPTSLHHKQQYLDSQLVSEQPKWYALTTALSENQTFPFVDQSPNHSSAAAALEPSTKSTTSNTLNNFETIKETGIPVESAQPLISHAVTTHPKSGRTRHMVSQKILCSGTIYIAPHI